MDWLGSCRETEDVATIKKIMGENVQGDKGDASVLNAWLNNTLIALLTPDDAITLSGPKVNSFSLNLQGFENEVTNDAWMANWAFVDQGDLAKQVQCARVSAGYIAMSVLTRRAAVDANMDLWKYRKQYGLWQRHCMKQALKARQNRITNIRRR